MAYHTINPAISTAYWDSLKTGIIDPGYPAYIVSASVPPGGVPASRWALWVSALNYATGAALGEGILAGLASGAGRVIVNEINASLAAKITDANNYLNDPNFPARRATAYGRYTYFVAHQATGAGGYNATAMRACFLSAFAMGCPMAVEQYARAQHWCTGIDWSTNDPYLLNFFLGNGYGNTWGTGSPAGAYGWSYLVALRNQNNYSGIPLFIVFGVSDQYVAYGNINPGDFIKRLHAIWNRYSGFAGSIGAGWGGAGGWVWRSPDMTTTSRDVRFVEAFNTYSVQGSITPPALTC